MKIGDKVKHVEHELGIGIIVGLYNEDYVYVDWASATLSIGEIFHKCRLEVVCESR